MKFEGTVSDNFNLYKLVRDKYGTEDEEQNLPNPYGATSIRIWKNGIVIVRSVEEFGAKMIDKVDIPDRPEFEELIKQVNEMEG